MPGTYRSGSIKRFISIWVAGLTVTCGVLSAVMLVLTDRLEDLTIEAVESANVSEAAYRLQSAILSESREDLHFRMTHADSIRADKLELIRNAQEIVLEISRSARTEQRRILVGEIREVFDEFAVASTSLDPPELSGMRELTDRLLSAVEEYRRLMITEMNDAVGKNFALRRDMQFVLSVLVLGIAGIIVVGSILLIRRIITPVIALSRTAERFGRGEFDARVPIFRNDELGGLSRTINNMADDIAQREKSRMEFSAAVFHDIKNPLAIIGGAVRMMRRKVLPRDQLEQWLDRVIRETDRLEDISQDLMDIARMESGKMEFNMAELDLAEMVAGIHIERKDTIETHAIEYEGTDGCRVLGDRRRLERVVINLLSNAVKYSPEGTVVTLRVERTADRVLFSVSDQGVGIAEEDMKVLFQPFGRLARTREMARGTGLGLFIVRRIIESHGGEVIVRSTLGEGTSIGFGLPLLLKSASSETGDTPDTPG